LRRVLVVYWWPDDLEMRVAVEQHLRALDRGPDRVTYLNACHRPPRWHRLESYDAVVLHTTFLCLRWGPDFARDRRAWSWLAELDCPKIALPQDEYDHADVLDEWLEELGVTTVFSNFDEQTRARLYSRLPGRARFLEALTGYIDDGAAAYCAERSRPHAERPFDVVYRAVHLPFWFGSHGQLKHRIGAAAQKCADAQGLRADISTRSEDTIFGPAWLDFLMSGRATVGVESGSSVLDPRGEIQHRIRDLLELEPALTFEEVDARMPPGWDSYAFFAISPRHLEAVIARTCQVLVEGTFSGVLEPERHFVPVRRDLSDLGAALEQAADPARGEEIAHRTYEDVYVNGTWTTDDFARRLRDVFTEQRPRRRRSIFVPAARIAETAVADVARRPRLRSASDRARFAVAALESARGRPVLARLLLRTLATGPWRGVIGRELARDLVRLDLVDRFDGVRVETEGDEVRLVTVPRDGRPAARYEFAALSRLARMHPELSWTEVVLRRR
jgi:hypothetical protein